MRSVIVWPETDRAVQTIPAMAITKNMPVVPDSPNRNSTTAEMMIVSIVIPDTGFRAVVAMAFAATEAKKKEKATVRARPHATTGRDTLSFPRNIATAIALSMTPMRIAIVEISRSVRSSPSLCPLRKARAAMAKEPATILRDLIIPKIPAVAIVPTPIKRT